MLKHDDHHMNGSKAIARVVSYFLSVVAFYFGGTFRVFDIIYKLYHKILCSL